MKEAYHKKQNYPVRIEGTNEQILSSEFAPELRAPLNENPLFMIAVFWVVPLSSLLLIGLIKALKRRQRLHHELYRISRIASYERLFRLQSKKKS